MAAGLLSAFRLGPNSIPEIITNREQQHVPEAFPGR